SLRCLASCDDRQELRAVDPTRRQSRELPGVVGERQHLRTRERHPILCGGSRNLRLRAGSVARPAPVVLLPQPSAAALQELTAHIPEKWAPVFRKGYASLEKL